VLLIQSKKKRGRGGGGGEEEEERKGYKRPQPTARRQTPEQRFAVFQRSVNTTHTVTISSNRAAVVYSTLLYL